MELSLSTLRVSSKLSHTNSLPFHKTKPLNVSMFNPSHLLKQCSQNPSRLQCISDKSFSKPVPAETSSPFTTSASVEAFEAAHSETGTDVVEFCKGFWEFLRPHTIRGTTLASLALGSRLLMDHPELLKWSLLLKTISGFVVLICANGFIVGINQIYDIGIDKVNKPYLPIASGLFSIETAWVLVVAMAVTGLLLVGSTCGPITTGLYLLVNFLGILYSVPPFRMKRSPVAAFVLIMVMRGLILHFGIHHATSAHFGIPYQWSLPVGFLIASVTNFALVISITKDSPDVEGDNKYNIPTFATRLGVRNATFLGAGLLLAQYAGAICAAIYMPQVFRAGVIIPAHTFLGACLVYQVWVVEKAKYTHEALTKFYKFIWNLFYLEYILFPIS